VDVSPFTMGVRWYTLLGRAKSSMIPSEKWRKYYHSFGDALLHGTSKALSRSLEGYRGRPLFRDHRLSRERRTSRRKSTAAFFGLVLG
jgi:hypothetical protein